MNDFVRENAQLSPLKVCVAVLLRTRFLAATAAQLPQDDLTALDTVLVDLLSESGAHTTRFRDLLARLHAHPFQVPDQVIAVYTSAVCALFFHRSTFLQVTPLCQNRSAKSSRFRDSKPSSCRCRRWSCRAPTSLCLPSKPSVVLNVEMSTHSPSFVSGF